LDADEYAVFSPSEKEDEKTKLFVTQHYS
jgi:hypothetical protein